MAFATTDIKLYKSAAANDTDANGGAIGTTLITSGAANNLFPNVLNSERTAGLTRYRKAFIRNVNTGGLTLYNGLIWISTQSAAADYFRLKLGTDSDIQSAADDYTAWKGTGQLKTSVSAAATEITVTYDAASGVNDGDTLIISDGANTETATVDGAPSWSGNDATITLSAGLANDYSSSTPTTVATAIELPDLATAQSGWSETSTSGTYDESTYPLTLYNAGTVSDDWTITFTSASAFTVAGAATGSLGAGSIAADFKPANGGSYYFELDKDGWGGTWAVGETITFTTTHAGQGFWVKEVVPAGAAAYSNNTFNLTWQGDAA